MEAAVKKDSNTDEKKKAQTTQKMFCSDYVFEELFVHLCSL